MYIYLYDSFLKDKKHASLLSACENRLTDFGIFGKIIRITTFTNPGKIIEDEMRRGAKTAVIVGNDETFARVIARAAELPVVFGYIPIGEKTDVATMLGIPKTVISCDHISRRSIEKIDVCEVNDRFFFRKISLHGDGFTVTCDNTYTIVPEGNDAEIAICNLDVPDWMQVSTKMLRPQDGRLTVFVRPSKKTFFRRQFSRASVLQVKKVKVIAAKPIIMRIDGIESKEHHIDAKVTGKKFSLIVGKKRKF